VTKFPTPGSEASALLAERAADQRTTVPQVRLTEDQVLDGAWTTNAACRNEDPETFHDQRVAAIALAQSVCAQCPFNQPCREFRYATGASGTWAGVYYADSSAGVRTARKKCALQRCTNHVRTNNPYCSFACEHRSKAGTRTGYKMHLAAVKVARAAGLPITDEMRMCDPCRNANSANCAHRRRPAVVS
jgi:hypothetical protein